MSVRQGDRSDGKCEAITHTRVLLAYTYDRVHDKTLPKSDRWLMGKAIWDAAFSAYNNLCVANRLRLDVLIEAEERIRLERIAVGEYDVLNSLIDMLDMKDIITSERADFRTGLSTTAQVKAMALLKSNMREARSAKVKE